MGQFSERECWVWVKVMGAVRFGSSQPFLRTVFALALLFSGIQLALIWSENMTRVTGIGGVFIKAKDPEMLQNWYRKHLGIDVQVWGGTSFKWEDDEGKPCAGTTAWMIGNGENFTPSEAPFMVNYRVADLNGLLAALRAESCQVLEHTEESEFGKFAWVIDPEGNKLELWEPPAGQ